MSDRRFVREMLRGSAPLWVWALHFFAVYVLIAVLCCGASEAALGAASSASSVAALVLVGWLLARGRHMPPGLLRSARLGCGALALVGVAWTTAPLLGGLPACLCG